MKKFFIYLIFCMLFATTLLAKPNTVQKNDEAIKVQKKVKKILNTLDFDYIEKEDGIIKVPVEIDNKTMIVYVTNKQLYDDIPESQMVVFFTVVKTIDKNLKLPSALYKELNRINFNLELGNVVYTDGLFMYSATVWGENIDENIMVAELYTALYDTYYAQEKIEDFIEE